MTQLYPDETIYGIWEYVQKYADAMLLQNINLKKSCLYFR